MEAMALQARNYGGSNLRKMLRPVESFLCARPCRDLRRLFRFFVFRHQVGRIGRWTRAD